MVHFFGSDFPGTQELSKSWLDSNFISPHYYLTLNARGKKGKIVAGGEIYKINKEYYVERPKKGGLRRINRVRKNYGLWPIEEEIKMINNDRAGKNLEFRMKGSVSSWPSDLPVNLIKKYFIKVG